MTTVAPPSQHAKDIVDKIVEDIEDSVYMGAAFLVLAPVQRERMKQRWAKIIESSHVDRDWANY